MASVVLGGVGRLLSSARYGAGPPVLRFFLATELLGAPAMLAWHAAIMRET